MKGFTKDSFIEDCLNGHAEISDLDNYVDFWHNHETGKRLHNYLGISVAEYEEWSSMDDNIFFSKIIDKKKCDHQNVKTKCINGDLRIGNLVLSTPDNEHSCLVGRVTDIKLMDNQNSGLENEVAHVSVNFLEMNYSPKRIKEIETMFSEIYDKPTEFGDLHLDSVIIAPNSLIRIDSGAEKLLEFFLDDGRYTAEYCYVVLRNYSIPVSALKLSKNDIVLIPELYFLKDTVTAHVDRNSNIVKKLGISLDDNDWFKIYLEQNLKTGNFAISCIHGAAWTDNCFIFGDFSDHEKLLLAYLMDEVSVKKSGKLVRDLYNTAEIGEILKKNDAERTAILKMQYHGTDDWDSPVYKDEFGNLWKDVNLGCKTPSLCSVAGKCMEGDPDMPIRDEFEIVGGAKIVDEDKKFRYMMLGRLKSDCDYYLGFGARCKNRLYSGDEKKQISYMKQLWNSFPDDEKPVWLTWDQIAKYEEEMVALK